jgi:type IV secretion system protein VirB9
MIKMLLAATALSVALIGPAFAEEPPVQSHRDSRVRTVAYRPDDVVPIWSMVGATLAIEFGQDESVPDGNVSIPDAWNEKEHKGGLEAYPQGNILTLKSHTCMVREPLLVTTRLATGKLRLYAFEFHTIPDICPKSSAPAMVAAMPVSTASDPPPPLRPFENLRAQDNAQGNLRYVGRDDLGPQHDVDYVVRFSYPLDEAARRRAAAARAAERARKEETELLLQQQTSSSNPWLGDRNYRYLIRGDGFLTPALVWDNGYSTAFTFPAMQRMPSLFRINPDGKEATSDYSVHGDTMIATGTAQLWRLRDGQTVAEILDLGFNPTGKTPGTGTVSPYVTRTIKGGEIGP